MRVPSRSPGHQSGPPVTPARRRPRGSVRPLTAAPPDLEAYREAVAELLVEVGALAQAASTNARQVLIDQRLREPAIAKVLEATSQGLIGARETLLLEMARYQPNARSSAGDLAALVRIYLLSRVDVMWWRDASTFLTDTEVHHSTELVDLEWLRRRDLLRFRYTEQPRTVVGRGVRAVRRRMLPDATPRTAGLLFRRARREVVALLNDIGREFAAATPAGTPPLWVTSLVRSAEHQYRLRRLGYAAMVPSGHCLGWAADVEMEWFGRFGVRDTLAGLLLSRQRAGEINVVDEGQAWHICLAPSATLRLRRAYEAEMGI
ncbi:hypothetical protein SAMN05443287_104391 [Micromonospora phaseoli]|uniref:Uncharacterized protein n=1 Tax=Micromonospora phaseoli TaxID=1144548 RepID=A0A1H6Z2W5_9ACTN|nr:DUF5715 family protein [Micromonospora phaseoli]PZW00362.1 hypothetical protein CLV64_103390 [Micromonospora phaseoli]GIJ76840.1 hypothetical protein Xph01_12720 [Micromonospora phaseoli]SEJ43942.1 hypothetical protein SAMN05443287_104391 [Micromonospora phaseoli]